ncbi:MAG: hypothetical protein RLZZ293_633 [Pseudomonadota bacterium]|jgi:ABC-type polysaccharide/polyol phosphate transport system ATPase subunit
MATNCVIEICNLSKIYKLYLSPIDRLKEALHFKHKTYHKEFFALKQINLQIKSGECLGVLGANGAGKSTLLKVITGITTPTHGEIKVRGRIIALLELGAGFNLEYSGLENIYFQANLLGLTTYEINSKLELIQNFADIGEFIYQPVKNYSSGMFARLAFAIAINLEPDILIIDETLSVGDIAFQNKCLRKISDIIALGITILFVSHDLQAINKLCNRVIWIKDGTLYQEGKCDVVINAYASFLNYGLETTSISRDLPDLDLLVGNLSILNPLSKFGTGEVEILQAGFYDQSNQKIQSLKQLQKIKFQGLVKVIARDIFNVAGGILFIDRLNNHILTINSYMYAKPLELAKIGSSFLFEFEFIMPKIAPGDYVIDIAVAEGTQLNHLQLCWLNAAMTVTVISNDGIECGCLYCIDKVKVEYHIFD